MLFYECISREHSINCTSIIYVFLLLAEIAEVDIEDVVRAREQGNSEKIIAIDSGRYLYIL